MSVYQDKPHSPAQSGCPHRIRTKDECSVCGSKKVGNRWVYLTPDWLAYYLEGKPRPPEVDDVAE